MYVNQIKGRLLSYHYLLKKELVKMINEIERKKVRDRIMTESSIFRQLDQKEVTAKQLADQVIQSPNLLPEIFEGLKADRANIKYGCLKVLRLISEKQPAILYPRFDFFVELLDSEVTFFKWGAILIIANLTAVDSDHKFESIFDRYFAPITDHVMIPAANIIGSSAKIALAKPELTEQIAREILKVEHAVYQTDECRNVAIGHAIKSFYQFFDQIKDKEPVIEFIKRQLTNTRGGTKKAAKKFVKKYLG